MLRQPLEEKKITVTRLNGILEFPADFMMICAMNPCRCGQFPSQRCTCSEAQIRKYLSKISGPFLDRIDIGVEVPPVSYSELRGPAEAGKVQTEESSASMLSLIHILITLSKKIQCIIPQNWLQVKFRQKYNF